MFRRVFFIVFLTGLAACGGSSAAPPDGGPSPDADNEPHRCDLADCENGFARTCDDDPIALNCTAFGGSCSAFTDTDSGAPFQWCSCGSLGDGEGYCTGGRFGVACVDGLAAFADCGVGFTCNDIPSGPYAISCSCNNIPDGICPDTSCTSDPDCSACTPSCAGRECGDNGCGGQCGTCAFGESCSAGQCEQICVPNCTNKQCGDDGCGGSCGTCNGTCSAGGQCQGTCVPSCDGKTCGDDGCGGSCGTCTGGLTCNNSHACACDFFDQVTYKFSLAPQSSFPTAFSFVGVNVTHIKPDGTEGTPDGAFMGYGANSQQTFSYTQFACHPKIRIKRDYALSGKTCTITEVIDGRDTFVIPPPTLTSTGCTAPPL